MDWVSKKRVGGWGVNLAMHVVVHAFQSLSMFQMGPPSPSRSRRLAFILHCFITNAPYVSPMRVWYIHTPAAHMYVRQQASGQSRSDGGRGWRERRGVWKAKGGVVFPFPPPLLYLHTSPTCNSAAGYEVLYG